VDVAACWWQGGREEAVSHKAQVRGEGHTFATDKHTPSHEWPPHRNTLPHPPPPPLAPVHLCCLSWPPSPPPSSLAQRQNKKTKNKKQKKHAHVRTDAAKITPRESLQRAAPQHTTGTHSTAHTRNRTQEAKDSNKIKGLEESATKAARSLGRGRKNS
jgi:hypothetical protein